MKEAKNLAIQYNFVLANIDIDIELVMLKIQYGKYEEAQFIYDDINRYGFISTYGKRLGAINTISNILKSKI